MNCMKCGREIALGQVFCKECQADMDKYPVKPGTPVILPPPPTSTKSRGAGRKTRKPEEQLSRLRRLMACTMLVFTIIIVAGTMLVWSLCEKIDTLNQQIASISTEYED